MADTENDSRDEEGARSADDLRITELEVGEERLVVLSFPLASYQLPETLTEAEYEIGLALLQGKSNREISDLRGTSERTVANQIASIFRKMDVSTRAEFARLAARPDETGEDLDAAD